MGSLNSNNSHIIQFTVPSTSNSINTVFSVSMNVNGAIETVTKPVPVSTPSSLLVHFFPESGDLICGVTNQVYFQIQDEKGNTVNIEGVVETREGKRVAGVDMGMDGRGRIEGLQAEQNVGYQLRVIKPTTLTQSVFPFNFTCVDSLFMSYSGLTKEGQIIVNVASKKVTTVEISLS